MLKSRVKFPQSLMVWGAVSSAGVGSLGFLKSRASVSASFFPLPTSFMELLIPATSDYMPFSIQL